MKHVNQDVGVEILEKELAKTQRALDDKSMVFDTILESTLAGYWDWHIKEDYEYLSPTFKAMFGYEDHELPNKPDTWQKIIHPEDLPMVFEIFEKHVKSRGKYPYDNEVRYFHKDGSIVWVYCRGKVIEWDEEGNPVRMVGSHVNITSLKEAEQEKIRAKFLEVKNQELEQFVYVASHDLQEPLKTVSSYIELVEKKYKEQLDEKGAKYLSFIHQASERMKALVKGLLDYSRIGKNKDLVEVNCNELLSNLLEDMAVTIGQSEADVQCSELPVIKAYEVELMQLFQNLISNAIKFQKPDTNPKIKITAEQKPYNWVFSVQDNGIGIEPEYQERIFLLFQRLHTRSEYQGTGIGLAHCRKIVEMHGGRLWVDSVQNTGSTFYFTISTKIGDS